MANSTLSLTFTQNTKELVCSGVVGVRESVDVTVVGGAAFIAAGLTLKIQGLNNRGLTTPVALFPLASGDAWVTSGLNATCTVEFNTAEMIAAFASKQNMQQVAFNLLLHTTAKTLMCNGVLVIINFPSSVTADPVTLSEASTVAALTARVAALEVADAGVLHTTDFAALDFDDLNTDAKRNAALRALLAVAKGG